MADLGRLLEDLGLEHEFLCFAGIRDDILARGGGLLGLVALAEVVPRGDERVPPTAASRMTSMYSATKSPSRGMNPMT